MTEGFIEFVAHPAEPKQEHAEIITALLGDYPFTTFDFDGNVVKAWANQEDIDQNTIQDAEQAISAYCEAPCAVNTVEKENWNAAWESQFFEPVTVDDAVHIRAPFHPPGPDVAFSLTIEPRMSFGTGHHATTRLMVSLMLRSRERFKDAAVLDMGSGTGVLGILAEKLGARDVLAIDNESWAAENAAGNAAANGCSVFRAVHGDAASLTGLDAATFDVVLANIHLNILLADSKAYLRVLKPGGLIFFSGFYESDLPLFQANMEKLGLKLQKAGIQDGWCAAVFVK